jgi:hypothetical protein
MKFYRRKGLTGILVLIVVWVLVGQVSNAIEIRGKRHDRNLWAFQAAIEDRADDDIDHNVRFSLKYRNSKHSAVRFNLELANRDTEIDYDKLLHVDGFAFRFNRPGNDEYTGVNLSVHYLMYPSQRGSFRPYWGMGPRLSIHDVNPGQVYLYDENNPYYWYDDVYFDDVAMIGLGAEAVLGIEWRLGRSISLLAEYDLVVQNEWYFLDLDYYDSHYYRISDDEVLNDGAHFYASRIKLGLAVSF